ncbi:MAG: flavodoxin domain-containing protein, partial [Blastococcus sp.]
MRVLVVVASKHGSTQGIAEAIADELSSTEAGQALGLTAVLQAAEHAPDPGGFDVVLVGSAVYAGRWLPAARDYVSAH